MTNTLLSGHVRTVLNRLFAAASHDDEAPRWNTSCVSWESATAQERADALQTAYLPISKTAGELLYILVRAMRPATIVEFGTSYGISTLHLAAAVSDNGVGRVVSTELNSAKVTAARANLAETGLSDHVAILPGVQSLENRLSPGALIVADDIILPSMSDYLAYVRNPANGYSTVAFPVEDGMEISCWTARAA